MGFVHLRVHSAYSLRDGLGDAKQLVAAAVQQGMGALALTDHCNLHAQVKFYQAALEAGVKPICGSDFWLLEEGADAENRSLCTLLAANDKGYHNLMALISRAHLEGETRYNTLRPAWLREHTEGLIALCGMGGGDIEQALQNRGRDYAAHCLGEWLDCFADRFYLNVQRIGRGDDEEQLLDGMLELALSRGCPLVASNEVCFPRAEQFRDHELRVCVQEGRTLDDPRRTRRYTEKQYLRSVPEMEKLFADLPQALQNSVEIARRCTVRLKLGKFFLPSYALPEEQNEAEYFHGAAVQGMKKRLEIAPQEPLPEAYQKRLEHEMAIIEKMQFMGYYLILEDIVGWAKKQGIPVGPGRGSGVGSLVAYALGITAIDPLPHDLLFERFLNIERRSMPDFDIDFCVAERDRVIQYVVEKYGADCVAQVATFAVMAARAAVRDVARVLGKPLGLADRIAKLIPMVISQDDDSDTKVTIPKALKDSEELRDMVRDDREAKEIIERAQSIEGTVRQLGKHAGGVVIAPRSLRDFVPLCRDTESGRFLTQMDKDDLEKIGLVKFDFLGLKNLTMIDNAKEMIRKNRVSDALPLLEVDSLPTDDAATYKSLSTGYTLGVFQMESEGMQDLVRRLKPESFDEIVALVALHRPGPLRTGMAQEFIDRKFGRKPVSFPHPLLEPVLENTRGVILYQEQVMQIARSIAGYSALEADFLRSAMGKKKPAEMKHQEKNFLKGAKAQGITQQKAQQIYDLIKEFAQYGFNKSHSVAYALIAYQTAWLKTHHPAEFMAAVLSIGMGDTGRVEVLLRECRRMGVTVRPPDVLHSQYEFVVDASGAVLYGLGAIKGVGARPVEAIVESRSQDGDFRDLYDFCLRTVSSVMTRQVVEAFVSSGALDFLGADRGVLWAAAPDALQAARQEVEIRESGAGDLWEGKDQAAAEIATALPAVPAWEAHERLRRERESLGFYFSGHPLDAHLDQLQRISVIPFAELRAGNKKCRIAGEVINTNRVRTRNGKPLLLATLGDSSGRLSVKLFEDLYEQGRSLLRRGTLVILEGRCSSNRRTNSVSFRASALHNITDLQLLSARQLLLRLPETPDRDDVRTNLHRFLVDAARGPIPIVIECTDTKGRPTKVRLSDHWSIAPTRPLLERLQKHYGKTRVELVQ